jgi:hypothetical protein
MTPPAAAAALTPTDRRASGAGARRPHVGAATLPRRVSGPARGKLTTPPARSLERSAHADGGLAVGLLAALNRLARHRLLDRLIVGRTWIALVAFALIGIVTLQLGLLELNASIGRALEREALLQRQNAALSIENSELAAGERVETQASRLGMELVPMGALRFLTASPRIDAIHAAAALRSPTTAPSAGSADAGSGEASSAEVSSGESGAGAPAASATLSATPDAEAASTSPASASAPAQSPDAATGQSSTSQGESTAASGSTPSASVSESAGAASQSVASSPSSAATAGGGSAEASPGGGTQAGSTG